jgi:hypothetical protein
LAFDGLALLAGRHDRIAACGTFETILDHGYSSVKEDFPRKMGWKSMFLRIHHEGLEGHEANFWK